MSSNKQSQTSQMNTKELEAQRQLSREQIRSIGRATHYPPMISFGILEDIMEAYGIKPSTDDM